MAHARAWWGSEGEPPIDFSDMRTDECGFVPVNGETINAELPRRIPTTER